MPEGLRDALAASFRAWPRHDDDTLAGLRLSDAVRIAHGVAAPLLAEVQAVAAGHQANAEAAEAAIAAARADAAAKVDQAAADYEHHADELGDRLASLEHAANARTARTAALEALYVQAKARWDHEGGPDALRDALATVEATRG